MKLPTNHLHWTPKQDGLGTLYNKKYLDLYKSKDPVKPSLLPP